MGVFWCIGVGVGCLVRVVTGVGGAARKDGEDMRGLRLKGEKGCFHECVDRGLREGRWTEEGTWTRKVGG